MRRAGPKFASRTSAYVAVYADNDVTWASLRRQLCDQAGEAHIDAVTELKVGSRPYSRLVQLLGFELSTGGDAKKLTGIAIRYEEAAPWVSRS